MESESRRVALPPHVARRLERGIDLLVHGDRAGTRTLELAASYLRSRFRAIGLDPRELVDARREAGRRALANVSFTGESIEDFAGRFDGILLRRGSQDEPASNSSHRSVLLDAGWGAALRHGGFVVEIHEEGAAVERPRG